MKLFETILAWTQDLAQKITDLDTVPRVYLGLSATHSLLVFGLLTPDLVYASTAASYFWLGTKC